MVRAVVDGWELAPPGGVRGIGRFLLGLLPELSQHVDLTVLCPDTRIPPETPAESGRWQLVHRAVAPRRVRASEVEHLVRLPWELRTHRHDVAWAPGTLPLLWSRTPWVQTIHDLAPVTVADPRYAWERRRWAMVGRRVRRATAVITPSRFSADEVIRVLGIPADRIHVVPHGVPDHVAPNGPADPLVRGPSIAVVGQTDPRKGLAAALEVSHHLRLAGHPHTMHVVGAVRPREHLADVRWRGWLEDADLARLLRSADVVLVTSRHEGFGFVPLEAMASGTPVVAFDAGAVREVVGDAGVLVPVGDAMALSDRVAELLADATARSELSAAGLQRAEAFSWRAAARAHADILRDVV